ncbi:lipoprotein [Vibrio sp. SCSIO 43135]|jgi:predicted small lipoprotein YifL|uniref:Lipoprotein n=1 Tax=Vibrio paucivorans TaxID=2829489 RepID=A0A9X3HSH2_9VIBR|nr:MULTISPECIES: lipoprotein [Vibrio]MCW8334990.1 lipoprotein [Vibrio paucivorans]USD41030.1 lipoprotein [Vibrio sp. SCSIO 43135]
MKFSIVHPFYPIAFPECGAIIGGIELIITKSKMKKYVVALFMFSVLALAGCGQTGPLYMPEDAPQNEQAQ